MSLLQAVLLGLIALILTPGYLFYFDVTPKVVLLLFGTAALLLAGRRLSSPRLFSCLILLNLASLALSTALSTRPGLSIVGTSWREFGLVPQAAALLLAWTISGTPQSKPTILRAIAITGILAGAYGIAQYFGWDPLLPAAAYHIGEGIWSIVRAPGTMGYVSYFATWLAMAAFLGIALAEKEPDSRWRLAAWFSAGVCAFAMLLTGTRAAMLALAVGFLVWLSFRRGSRRRATAIAIVTLLVFVGFYFSPAGWNLRSRARWFVEDASGGSRLLLWRDSLRMAAARPVAGFGPETFTAQFTAFESPQLARQRPDFEYESPHNMFLDALTAQGAFGILALAALCAAALIHGIRSRNAGLTAALVAGIVSQQFSVMTAPTALLFYVTCALLAPIDRPAFAHTAVRMALAIAFIACAVPLALGDRLLARAQTAIKAGDSSSAAALYARYWRVRLPGEFAADIWCSRAALDLAQRTQSPAVRLQALAQAHAAAARAPQTADDPFNAWYNLAAFDSLTGDSAAAEHDLRQAIAARPNWFKPHWTLARLLLLESRLGEAANEAALAVSLDAGKDPDVTRTLMEARDRLHR